MKISISVIESLLCEALTVSFIEIIDESDRHKGHLEMKYSTDSLTHVVIRIQAHELHGLSRIEQHRKIYTILQPAIDSGLHAIRIEVL
jgi:BolA protein